MKFSDEGIIIGIKKYGENSSLLRIFSQNNGVLSTFVRSIKSSKDKVIYQVGNLISFEYRQRADDNLGQIYYVDLVRSYLSSVIFDSFKMNCASSLFSIINVNFLEKDNQEILFEKLHNFLQKIVLDEVSYDEILSDYIKLELKILKVLGYGLDLSVCAVTNSKTNLAFVSPKSARAVCFEVGLPYQNKLLKLPKFLVQEDADKTKDCLRNGLNLSGFFLQKFLYEEKSVDHNFLFRRKTLEAVLLI